MIPTLIGSLIVGELVGGTLEVTGVVLEVVTKRLLFTVVELEVVGWTLLLTVVDGILAVVDVEFEEQPLNVKAITTIIDKATKMNPESTRI
jgi:hypothetical protein